MALDMNVVMIIGRLTRDGELTYTPNGFPILKFSIAVNRRRKEGDNWIDEANFFDIVLWGKSGESLHRFLQKGQLVAVQGSLRQERWEQDGMKRSRISIEANNVQLLGSRNDAPNRFQDDYSSHSNNYSSPQVGDKGSEDFQSYANNLANNKPSPPDNESIRNFEDDIPF